MCDKIDSLIHLRPLSYENRLDQRHRPDWLEERRHSASGRPRGDRRLTESRRQHDYRRWAVAGAHVVIDLSNSPSF